MKQKLIPEYRIFHAGDSVTFRLEGIPAAAGRAVLRTNLGRAKVRRQEIIRHVQKNQPITDLDWHDIELTPCALGCAEVTVPLCEVGVFEAKCCFIPADRTPIVWPEGDNIRLKVESACSVTGNTIYSAFVRQFGSEYARAESSPLPRELETFDRSGYVVIPPSGSFRRLKRELPHVFRDLRCRILQLLPVHPVPVSFGRMGRYGSPFAATDYFSVDPALAEFDPKATPLEQFVELIDAVHSFDGRLFMDIPVNHTGWASRLQTEHPEYFVRKADGTFESPGAWGVVWADLCKLNYREPAVRDLMAEVFLFWCRHGVDGFRCDAGYMLPAAAWEFIVSRVREEYPDTIFLLEGLGGKLEVQEELLGRSGLDWGYSELFQNYTRDQIANYYPYAEACSRTHGLLVNFAETHDNNRLAATSQNYAKIRFAVNALLAGAGGFGFANGAEYFATEKIDVHGCGALNWGKVPNLVDTIRTCNMLLADHRAFEANAKISLLQRGPGNVIAALRRAVTGETLLVLLNLESDMESDVHWPRTATGGKGRDLISGKTFEFRAENDDWVCHLRAAEALCITFDDYQLPVLQPGCEPVRITRQRADAMARNVLAFLAGFPAAGKAPEPGKAFLKAPEEFAATASGRTVPPVTHWHESFDSRRNVMIPPGDVLLIESSRRFRVELHNDGIAIAVVQSLCAADGRKIAAVTLPPNETDRAKDLILHVTSFDETGKVFRSAGTIRQLAAGERCHVLLSHRREELLDGSLHVFSANRSGGISFFPAAWGRLTGKYDALLSGNVRRDCPVDRRTMFTRCRGWINVNGYSQVINIDSIVKFTAAPDNRAQWFFRLPAGQGCRVVLEVEFQGATDGDAMRFIFRRHSSHGPGRLPDNTPIRLILRPDLEDRVNHQLTKAYCGAEQRFPNAVSARRSGFDFTPAERKLTMEMQPGGFHRAPEWYYMVDLPAERYYGMEDKTDLFSPGYFEVMLKGGEETTLTATIAAADGSGMQEIVWPVSGEFPEHCAVSSFFYTAMSRYVVDRDNLKTVIAGYPWFLDWGRDTLIVLRGLLSPEFRDASIEIVRQFATFEDRGTIPNVIHGQEVGNRDTSDAPLYLIIAVRDGLELSGDPELLKIDCNGRKLIDVLLSIAANYVKGTPNGIKMDPESGLIYSPAHFTWMDTNYPAGTPRAGYPIEIQSLWYAALVFLGQFRSEYRSLAEKVQKSIEKLYFTRPGFCASDCLHCVSGTPAEQAIPDDHIRPNQLLAITLGAVANPAKQRLILAGCEELLVPGGIRSLADRPVEYHLPVERDGHLLNDPVHPYRGVYNGPEDTSRKVSYHNGTVWCWPFPTYCEALYKVGGEAERKRALALLLSASEYLESGVVGQLPEVADGNAPHQAGGCLAQAWSESEFFRVYGILSDNAD